METRVKRDDLIGHTLSNVLRSPFDVTPTGDLGEFDDFFAVGLEIDGCGIVSTPWSVDDGDLTWVDNPKEWVPIADLNRRKCIGQRIRDVYIENPGRRVVFLLENECYLSQDETEGGVIVGVESHSDLQRDSESFLDGLEPYFESSKGE